MTKYLKIIFYFLLAVVFSACFRSKKSSYSYNPKGYYYQLIAFDKDAPVCSHGQTMWVSASFKTQNDSVFWDSYNNFADLYFIKIDTMVQNNLLVSAISKLSVADSLCFLFKPDSFFRQQFKVNRLPFFSKKDSVVKVFLKIKNTITETEMESLKAGLRDKELELIKNFYKELDTFSQAKDSLGFYWVKKPSNEIGDYHHYGSVLKINYRGSFLTGRFLEKSPQNFELIYGTPDQLLKGINYAISRLKMGQNAKIILPSHLAFGEMGSTNGTVPPFTPLIYEIEIKN